MKKRKRCTSVPERIALKIKEYEVVRKKQEQLFEEITDWFDDNDHEMAFLTQYRTLDYAVGVSIGNGVFEQCFKKD